MKLVTSIILFSIFALAACAGGNAAISNKLDPLTAVTITYSKVPMVFYRDNYAAAAYARKFVQLAPLEVNRTGSFQYYLWLGIWNTIQDPDLGASRDGFESIVIYADGEPLPLELVGWSAEAIGASEPVYVKPVASAADAYYEVSVDHLRLIAASNEVRVQSTGARPQAFKLWDDQSTAKASLREFLNNSVY